MTRWRASLAAGALYFAVMFAIGFALGTVRVLWLEGAVGALRAVLLETPVMLGVSWIVCGRILARAKPALELPQRAVMGASALFLLLVAEAFLALTAFNLTFAEHLEAYREAPRLVGLAGQILFGLFPVMQRSD